MFASKRTTLAVSEWRNIEYHVRVHDRKSYDLHSDAFRCMRGMVKRPGEYECVVIRTDDRGEYNGHFYMARAVYNTKLNNLLYVASHLFPLHRGNRDICGSE